MCNSGRVSPFIMCIHTVYCVSIFIVIIFILYVIIQLNYTHQHTVHLFHYSLCLLSLPISAEELVGVTDQGAILKELQAAVKSTERQSEVHCYEVNERSVLFDPCICYMCTSPGICRPIPCRQDSAKHWWTNPELHAAEDAVLVEESEGREDGGTKQTSCPLSFRAGCAWPTLPTQL